MAQSASEPLKYAMQNIENLKKDIEKIKKRNKTVETDKAWEVSWTRRFFILVFTYLSIGIYLRVVQIERPWINAIIPALAFLLSTLTLPYIKKIWTKKYANN